MSTLTIENAIDRFGVDVLDYLDRQVTVPVVDFGRQGDVIVIPARFVLDEIRFEAQTPVPAEGVAVVRGENGGNTHLLVAEGPVRFDALTPTPNSLVLGTLTVPEDATAFLTHPEHGYIGFTPGTYQIRRQREQAEQVRLVTD